MARPQAWGVCPMAVEPRSRIERVASDQHELADDVGLQTVELLAFAQLAHGILGIERLGHVESVEPHLVRIGQLVPKSPVVVAGMLLQLTEKRVENLGVTCLARTLGQDEKGSAGADMVEIVLLFLVGQHRRVGPHDGIVIAPGILVEIGAVVSVGRVDHGQQFKPCRVVPLDFAWGDSVERRGRRVAGDFAFGHPHGQRYGRIEQAAASRAGSSGKQQRRKRKEQGSFHLIWGLGFV